MTTGTDTIGLRILSFLEGKQRFLKKRLSSHTPERFLILKLHLPERFTRLFDMHLVGAQRKLMPTLYLKHPMLIFSMPAQVGTLFSDAVSGTSASETGRTLMQKVPPQPEVTASVSSAVPLPVHRTTGRPLMAPQLDTNILFSREIPGELKSVRPSAASDPLDTFSPLTVSVEKSEESKPAGPFVSPVHLRMFSPLESPTSKIPGEPVSMPLPESKVTHPPFTAKLLQPDVKSMKKVTSEPYLKSEGEISEVPSPLLQKFSSFLNLRLPRVFIHKNRYASRYLDRHNAEAMARGQHIYFQQQAPDRANPRGMALLGHELTHVSHEYYPDQTGSEFSTGGREGPENAALRNERLVLQHAPLFSHAVSVPAAPLSGKPTSPAALSTSKTPHFAEASRDLSEPLSDSEPPEAQAAALSAAELMRVKEDIYRDLIMRMKIEFERGG